MKPNSVAICIPSIPPRKVQLARAISSALNQDHPVDQIVVTVDHERLGAAGNRNRAWRAADTEWVAFLDDDDELHPDHISTLLAHAEATGADLVYPWHRILVMGHREGPDILNARGMRDEQIIPELEHRNFIPINVMVKRSALEAVGGFPHTNSPEWPHADCEDWGCWKRLAAAGFKFSHIDKVTWTWHHWGYGTPGSLGNTSGKADRW